MAGGPDIRGLGRLCGLDGGRQLTSRSSGRVREAVGCALSWRPMPSGPAKDSGDRLLFQLYRVPRDGQSTEAELMTLKLIVGPGDSGEPVITILLPHED